MPNFTRLRQWADATWILNRRGRDFYIRAYPTPGFLVKIGQYRYKWSTFYGFKRERAI